MSRLIVKNIPKQISESELKSHFEKQGQITDCRIMFKEKKNRRIAFIGYKNDADALKAKEYFNNTYVYMSRISVDYAKTNDDPSLPRAWSKYSKGSASWLEKNPDEKNKKNKTNQENNKNEEKNNKTEEPIIINNEKKAKFEEFLQLMRKTQNPAISEAIPGPADLNDKKKKKRKNSKNVNGNQVTVTDLDENNLKAGVSSKRIHIKLSTEPLNNDKNNHEISKIINYEKNEEFIKNEKKKGTEEKVEKQQLDEKRLYVINLPFNSTEEEIRAIFVKYGKITELKLPKDRDGKFKGFVYVAYENESQALHAFSELDNKIVMGRILHLRPAYVDQNKKVSEAIDASHFNDEKTSYKKSKKQEMLEKVNDKTNWNSLFLNPNSVLASISAQYHLKKREILSMESSDQAVRIAMAETQIINETKDWLETQGVNLWFLNESRAECIRSDKIILIKNIAYECKDSELRELFDFYGVITRFLLSPNRSIAIVEFESNKFAENCFKNLSYYKFKGEPLYLEWAPIDILKPEDKNMENNELLMEDKDDNNNGAGEKILYIKNLNFKSNEENLKKLFQAKFPENEIISVKIIKKNGLSQGYGFVEFKSHDMALKALKLFQNTLLDEHSLKLSVSKANVTQKQKNNKRKRENIEPNNKIVIRNIAFEATKEDIQQLFKNYGDIKNVRLPRKMNKQHRGFAFVEFVSVEEANNAFNSLQNSHLYGRKLNLEWAEEAGAKKEEN